MGKTEAADGVDWMGKEAGAWLALAEGKGDEGLKNMRAVADDEDAGRRSGGGSCARNAGRNVDAVETVRREALAEYEVSLQANPNRF